MARSLVTDQAPLQQGNRKPSPCAVAEQIGYRAGTARHMTLMQLIHQAVEDGTPQCSDGRQGPTSQSGLQ